MDLGEVLEGGSEEVASNEVTDEVQNTEPAGDTSAEEVQAADPGTTPGADEGGSGDRQVPLQALLSERDKRQEMERKLAAIEERMNSVVQHQQASQRSEEDDAWTEEKILEDIPGALKRLEGGFEKRLKAERYSSSEFYAKKVHEDYDDVIARYTEAARANKYLANIVDESPMPALAAYEATKEWLDKTSGTSDAEASREIEALKQEIAKLKGQAPGAQVPQSLTTARGAGAAVPAAGAWSGPPSMEDLFG